MKINEHICFKIVQFAYKFSYYKYVRIYNRFSDFGIKNIIFVKPVFSKQKIEINVKIRNNQIKKKTASPKQPKRERETALPFDKFQKDITNTSQKTMKYHKHLVKTSEHHKTIKHQNDNNITNITQFNSNNLNVTMCNTITLVLL